ncbi:nif-specific transcriptional activator NifA [Desulfogranum mediterraneum]|uniref:nif-specific transcriptional activator NifA n=1 Tax=Desulfogranum mediterraneum TaxID=160661 RepID=UPI00040DD8C6|nr:nif-specific transcriptional activator NifA [Desulfogranum mediterraneum]
MDSNQRTGPTTSADAQKMELLALHRITELIGNAANLETTLANILAVLYNTMKMERATLLLYDQQRQKLAIKASYGLSAAEEMRGVYSLDEGISGRIFRTKSPFVVPDIQSEPLFLNRTGARSQLDRTKVAFLGVPVSVQGRPEGVLTVDRLFGDEVSFDEDIRFLMVLATLIAQFLTLHREIQKKEARLVRENESLKAKLHRTHKGHYIIGHSKPIGEVFNIIQKLSRSNATALLLGESGTGKELVARAIHESGLRCKRSFIKINCAALPETLLESELFGHERGAYTGAHTSRAGRFELADRGTLFLDEIGEMPLALQAKMLRVLQERQFERLGGTKTHSVDVRIIAATNVSLDQAVTGGRFRADLYYRLNVVPITLPPLRERSDDIPLLLNHFLSASNQRNARRIKISSELLDFLMSYQWPGNVREMQNLVERMVILAEGDRLTLNDLPSDLLTCSAPLGSVLPLPDRDRGRVTPPTPPPSSLQELERSQIIAALNRNGWVQAKAARELGLTQRQIGYRIKKFNLQQENPYRQDSE